MNFWPIKATLIGLDMIYLSEAAAIPRFPERSCADGIA